MSKKIVILTEGQIKSVVDNLMTEQGERIYKDFDVNWNYKFTNNMWYTSKKGKTNWKSLEKFPSAIQKLNRRYKVTPTSKKVKPMIGPPRPQSSKKTPSQISLGLKIGSRGGNVIKLQEKLISLGYDIVADGQFGPGTKDALVKFQNENKVPPSGMVDKKTLSRFLYPIEPLKNSINSRLNPTIGLDIKSFIRKLSPNAYQLFFTKSLGGNDFSRNHKRVMYNTIQNAIKRGSNPKGGGATYKDYGGDIFDSFPNIHNPKPGISTKSMILRSITDTSYQVAATLGNFSYRLQPNGTYIVTDIYDFSKAPSYTVSKDEIKGMNRFQQIRYIMKKENTTAYRALRQIGYIEHPDTASESEKAKISLVINPKDYA